MMALTVAGFWCRSMLPYTDQLWIGGANHLLTINSQAGTVSISLFEQSSPGVQWVTYRRTNSLSLWPPIESDLFPKHTSHRYVRFANWILIMFFLVFPMIWFVKHGQPKLMKNKAESDSTTFKN